MASLYFIRCRFKPEKDSKTVDGFAVCTSPDGVSIFFHPDGKPYVGESVWTYRLLHYSPWAKLDNDAS